MLVSFVCNRAEELYPMLECSISGNYGQIRVSPEEYRRKEASGQLTDQERQEFNEPGPFSITSYCEALLKSDFYGEELCLRLLSMLFKVRITVLDGDSLIGKRVRHQNSALNTDIILIHVSRCHYIAMGKFSFAAYNSLPKPHATKMHCDALSSIQTTLRSIPNVLRLIRTIIYPVQCSFSGGV